MQRLYKYNVVMVFIRGQFDVGFTRRDVACNVSTNTMRLRYLFVGNLTRVYRFYRRRDVACNVSTITMRLQYLFVGNLTRVYRFYP